MGLLERASEGRPRLEEAYAGLWGSARACEGDAYRFLDENPQLPREWRKVAEAALMPQVLRRAAEAAKAVDSAAVARVLAEGRATRAGLARQCGVSASAVSRLARGDLSCVSSRTSLRLHEAVGLPKASAPAAPRGRMVFPRREPVGRAGVEAGIAGDEA